jgi:Fe-S oxidoreductase
VLALKPIGLEGFDGLLVDFMRLKHLVVDDIALLPAGRGFLLCEFGADSPDEAERMADALVQKAAGFAETPTIARYSTEETDRVWKVRESALGATVFVPGKVSGWEGWEDSAVPPEQLGKYLRDLFVLIEQYGYTTPMYGHFGQGCVHLRITFDLKTEEGVARFRSFIDEAADIVLKYGGSLSGEHGDGQARAALLPKMFGPELMQAFADFKSLWDPLNRMNPGKLIDPVAVYDPAENLRIGPGYTPAAPKTWFQYPNDGGLFSEATTRCVGVGACRKVDSGTMCPSYMATREEKHSTRGRAHLLWEMMQGNLIADGWQNQEIKEALDLCLSCKACKTECPVNVDMAMWKSEFLAHHYEGKLHPLTHYAFGFMDRWASMASWAPSLANLPMSFGAVSKLAKKTLGVAQQRELPRFAAASFRSQHLKARRHRPQGDGPAVLLWSDTWNNYFYPQALHAAVKVLESTGSRVQIPAKHICCGRPLYDFGFLDQARAYLLRILDEFEPQIRAGLPVVMLEPSCASVFRDELINFFPTDERALLLSRQTRMLSEFVAANPGHWQPPDLTGRKLIVQGHCHQKSLMTMKDEMKLMNSTGAEVTLLDSGCCGMAGPFGFEADHFDVSQTLAERVLLPAVRGATAADILVSNGFSCREQIAQNSERRAVHVSEVLAGEALTSSKA